jgi:hypothetical protein
LIKNVQKRRLLVCFQNFLDWDARRLFAPISQPRQSTITTTDHNALSALALPPKLAQYLATLTTNGVAIQVP